MNGIIYCRVSSKEQIEGTSLETQEQACREYARSKNIKILKIFVERGESAKFADRTQLLELIDFSKENKGKINVLLVWKVDRFSRNVGDHFNIKAVLMKYGVRIVSVTEPIDSNPEGKLMETILAGFAQFDNDIRAMRTVQGMRRKLQEGIFPWKSPMGYRSRTKHDEKKMQPDVPEQPLFGLLVKAWKEFATGAYTKAEIRRLMTSWGVLTQTGKPISNQSLDNFFRNGFYAGILVDPWSGEEYEGKHMPMVSRQDFAHVQQIIKRRNRSIPHQKQRPEFPLRGVVRCSDCLRYLTGSFSRGRSRRYPYYHCGYGRCDRRGKSLPTGNVQEEFEAFLEHVAPKQELVEKLADVMVQAAEERQTFVKTKKARLETELARLKREIQELIRMKAQGLLTDEEFIAQKSILTEQRTVLESRAIPERVSAEQIRGDITEITRPLTELKVTWRDMPDPLRRRFDHFLLPAGFVNQRIRTAELGLLFAVFGEFSEGKSTGVPLAGKMWNRVLLEIQEFLDILRRSRHQELASDEAV